MEHEILLLLQHSPDTLFSMKEVGRKIDRDKFRENASWARPFLEGLVTQGTIVKDDNGLYCFPKPKPQHKLGEIV